MDRSNSSEAIAKQPVEIFTLGRFLVGRGGQLLSTVRSEKVWLLFKYLLTHREAACPPETILETLWPDQEYKDPGLAVRSLVHRLRRLFTEELAAPELASNIVLAHGCYRWTGSAAYRLDVTEFEELTVAAEAHRELYPSIAIDTLKKAKRLYLGDYLTECLYDEWALPARDYYRQLYVRSMIQLAGLLKDARRFAEIIELCRSALEIDYFEEKLHLYYLEALLEEGRRLQARSHYEKMTAAFYSEMGEKPSPALRRLYSRISFDQESSVNLNLSFIQEYYSDSEETEGAFICDPALFQQFYQLERRRCQRSGEPAYLGQFTLTFADYQKPPRDELQKAAAHLEGILKRNLRKGDVVCRSHEAQFLLILPNLDEVHSAKVISRLGNIFKQSFRQPALILHQKLQPIAPLKERSPR